MRVLFCVGEKSADGRAFIRPSPARCIAIEGDRVAVAHRLAVRLLSKVPGRRHRAAGNPRAGAGEGNARRKLGLLVIPDSIREFGCVRRVQASDEAEYDCLCAGRLLLPVLGGADNGRAKAGRL